MTEQAIEIGIPSFQLEIPRKVRNELFSNSTFFDKFAEGITDLYSNVILSYYANNENHPLVINPTIASNYVQTVNSATEAGEVRSQLEADV